MQYPLYILTIDGNAEVVVPKGVERAEDADEPRGARVPRIDECLARGVPPGARLVVEVDNGPSLVPPEHPRLLIVGALVHSVRLGHSVGV